MGITQRVGCVGSHLVADGIGGSAHLGSVGSPLVADGIGGFTLSDGQDYARKRKFSDDHDNSELRPKHSSRVENFGHACSSHECNEFMQHDSRKKGNHGMHVQYESSIANLDNLHLNSGSTQPQVLEPPL